jgi:hypothetical protein
MTKHVEGEAVLGNTDPAVLGNTDPKDSAPSGLVFQYVLTPMIGGAMLGTTAATWAAAAARSPPAPDAHARGHGKLCELGACRS